MAYDYQPSPNKSSRDGQIIDMIVLHATASGYASALSWLRNPQPAHPKDRVSTHYLIAKSGHVAQLVTDDQAAWHAGVASWHGHTNINERSIGIELENDDSGHDPYPPAQLAACRDLCTSKIAAYAILRANVVRHLDIAVPKGRKTDPAGFPFADFVASLYAAPAPAPAAPDPARYRVVDIHISQKQSGGPPYAGTLAAGALVEIDMIYPNNMCHMKNNAGFIPISAIEPAGNG